MAPGHSPKKQLFFWWSFWLIVEIAVALAAGWLLVTAVRWLLPEVFLGAIIGALFIVPFHFFLRTRHLAFLYDLTNGPPPVSILWRSAKPVSRAQASLRQLFQKLEGTLLTVVSAGSSDGNSYRDQMDLAYIFYSVHAKRFWATSFDRWSTFLLSNEPYVRQMETPCAHGHEAPSAPINEAGDHLVHARLFILPLRPFVEDILSAPSAARILVRHHLWAWHAPIRLLLHVESSYSERIKDRLGTPANGSAPIMPDFMIVDDLFVYGRVTPERVEAETIEPPKLEPPKVVLGYSANPSVVRAYASLFAELWNSAPEVRDYCASLRLLRRASNGPVATSNSVSGAAAARTLDALKEYETSEQEQLFATIQNIEGDLVDFFSAEERRKRYPEIAPTSSGKVLVAQALSFVRKAVDEIWAIDQADIKRSDRFWLAWEREDEYKPFEEATRLSVARVKQRIFIIKTWEELDSFPALSFVKGQLQAKVGLGFILQADVDRLAARAGGSSGVADSDPSKASIDSDFIVMDFDRSEHGCEAGGQTRGFEIAYKQYVPEEIRYETSLPCKDRIDRLLKWYVDVRDSGYVLFVLPDNPDIQSFERAVAARVPPKTK